jgi:WD40 repeat protein
MPFTVTPILGPATNKPSNYVNGASWNKDGDLMALALHSQYPYVFAYYRWDGEVFTYLGNSSGYNINGRCVAFSPNDGALLLTASDTQSAPTNTLAIAKINKTTGSFTAIQFPTGQTGDTCQTIDWNINDIFAAWTWGPGEKLLAYKYNAGTETATKLTNVWVGGGNVPPPGQGANIRFSPDGTKVALRTFGSGATAEGIYVYSISLVGTTLTLTLLTHTTTAMGNGLATYLNSACWSPDSQYLFLNNDRNCFCWKWDAANNKFIDGPTVPGVSATVNAGLGECAWSPDGKTIAARRSTPAQQTLLVWTWDGAAFTFKQDIITGSWQTANNSGFTGALGNSTYGGGVAWSPNSRVLVGTASWGANWVGSWFAYDVKPEPKIAQSFGAMTQESLIGTVDPYFVEFSPNPVFIGVYPLVPTIGQNVNADSYITQSFGALQQTIATEMNLNGLFEQGFAALRQTGILAWPVDGEIVSSFGAMTQEITIKKPNLNGLIEGSFAGLTAEIVVNVPIPASISYSFGGLQTTIIGSSPISGDLGQSFGKLTQDISVVIPDVARIIQSFGKLAHDISVVIPDVARIPQSFAALQQTIVAPVPYAPAITQSFGKLTATFDVPVPYAPAIAQGFAALTQEFFTFGINYSDTRQVFGRLGNDIFVAPPLTLRADLVLPMVTAGGELLQLNGIEGDVVLPYLDVAGALAVFYGVSGEIVLPGFDLSGELKLDYIISGDVTLPPVDLVADIYLLLRINGDAVLPPVELRGRTEGTTIPSPTGDAPNLMGGLFSGEQLRTGGGVWLGFDHFTIG